MPQTAVQSDDASGTGDGDVYENAPRSVASGHQHGVKPRRKQRGDAGVLIHNYA